MLTPWPSPRLDGAFPLENSCPCGFLYLAWGDSTHSDLSVVSGMMSTKLEKAGCDRPHYTVALSGPPGLPGFSMAILTVFLLLWET